MAKASKKEDKSKKEEVVEEQPKEDTDETDEEESSGSNWYLWGIIAILAIFLLYTYQGGITGNAVAEEELVDPNVIKIGFMAPLTGDAASFGQNIKRGVDLAYRDADLDDVQIIYEDSKCDGKEAVNSINKLINVDGVQAIVGEVCSGATLAAAPIAEANDVVLISASSTSPEITSSGDYIFRTIPSDQLQGAFGADLVYKSGDRTLAILYSNEEYGVGFERVLQRIYDGEIVASEAFERGSTDMRTQLTKIRAERPDAIYIISNSPDSSVAALKQITELGLGRVQVYGSEGLRTPEVAEERSAEGLIITSVSTGTIEFALKYEDEYEEEPGAFAAQGYDAFSALARVMKRGATTGEEMKNELYSTTFDGASGRISFDLNGDVSGNYEVYKLTKGEWIAQ